MKRKVLSVLLCMAMSMTLLAGCGQKAESEAAPVESVEEEAEEVEEEAEEVAEEVEEAEEEAVEETGNSAVVDQLYDEFNKAMAEQLGDVPEATGEEMIGAIVISLSNPFWANMSSCYQKAAQELGVNIDVQTGTTEGDTESQLDVLMTMADMGYDLVIVSPIDGTNLIPGIVKCNENGVKVINLGPGVDLEALEEAGGHLDGKITVNFAEQGATVANDIIKRLPEGGEVAILQGLAGAGQSEGRTKGATEVLEAAEGIDLVASVNCDWDATMAYDATKDILTSNPDLKAIFACNDVMALAACEALEAEEKEGVLVYGVDFTDEAREAMKEGKMTGSMSYSSVKYTESALKMAIAMIAGTEYAEPIYLPLTLVTVDNVNDLDGWA
ncbi:MAG: substrate-binding domain-containing protein [Lachnospiraceae bacterium]|nr:substrate-binding domain-containing protein [Candidatus Equihabitans merdae]